MDGSFTRTTPIRIYDRNEELKLILDPRGEIPYFDAWYTEQLNGAVTLEFSIPSNHPHAAYIENDGRAVIRDQDGELVEFIIRIPEDTHDQSGAYKRVTCEGGDYELIDEWMAGYEANGVDLKTALEAVLTNTRWKVGNVHGFEPRNVKIEPTTVKNAIHQLLDLFGGERRFRVVENGNIIAERFIDVHEFRGQKIGKRFEYGKDTQSIRRTIDSTGIKTALFGYGESGENDSPRLTFASIAWSKENGDPVDKPLGQTWIGDPDALQKWGYNKGSRHRFGVYSGQESDPAELLMNTWKELQKTKDAVFTYELKVALLEKLDGQQHEKVRLGDVVFAIDERINPPIRFEASIIEHRMNLNDDRLDEITVGNFRTKFDVTGRIQNAEAVIASARGRWDHKATPSYAAKVAKKEADRAIAAADASFAEAQDRIDAAELRIGEAETDINATISRITNAEGDIDSLQFDLGSAQSKLDQAVIDLNQAEIDITSAQTAIGDLQTSLGDAEIKIGDLETDLGSLNSNLSAANLEIDELQSSLTIHRGDIDLLKSDLDAAETSIGNLNNSLSDAEIDIGKAQDKIDSVTSVDAVTGETRLAGTLITNKIIAEDATLTGRLLGSEATILDLETDRMVARDVTIQDATIAGTIGANTARFIQATIEDATITGTIGANLATFVSATMQDATVTGSLNANLATFLSGRFEDATIVTATIQDATISGTIGAAAATFIEATMQDAIVSGTLNANAATFQSGTFNDATIQRASIADATITGSIGSAAATFVRATMQDAIVSGTLDAAAATFVSGTFDAATIIDATIQNATITGTLDGVSGSFTGQLNGANGTFTGSLVGGEISGATISGTSFESRTDTYGKTLIDGSTIRVGDAGLWSEIENHRVSWGYGDPEFRRIGVLEIGMELNKVDGYLWMDVGSTFRVESDMYFARDITINRINAKSNGQNILSDYGNTNIGLNAADGELWLGEFRTSEIIVRAPVRIRTDTYRTTFVETGYCGVGGQNAFTTRSGWNVAGVGVQWRIEKTYTPSSVSLTPFDSMSYNTSPYSTQITNKGFWLYVQSGDTNTGGYWYWRGTYRA